MKRTRATSDQSSPAAGTSSDAVSTPHAAARMEGALKVELKRRKLTDNVIKLLEDYEVCSAESFIHLGEEDFAALKTRGLKRFQQLDVQTIQRELQEEKERAGHAMIMDNKSSGNVQAGTIGTLNMPQSSSESKDQDLVAVKDLADRRILQELKSALEGTPHNVAHVCQTYTELYGIKVDPKTWEVLFKVMKEETHLKPRNFVDLQILLWNAKAVESVRAVSKRALELEEVFELHVAFLRTDPEETNGKEVKFHLRLNLSDFSDEKRGEWKREIAFLMKIRPDQISIEDVRRAGSIWVTVTMPAIVSEALQLKCRDQAFQEALAALHVDQLLFSTDNGEEKVEIRSSVSQSSSVEGVSISAHQAPAVVAADILVKDRKEEDQSAMTSAKASSDQSSPAADTSSDAVSSPQAAARFQKPQLPMVKKQPQKEKKGIDTDNVKLTGQRYAYRAFLVRLQERLGKRFKGTKVMKICKEYIESIGDKELLTDLQLETTVALFQVMEKRQDLRGDDVVFLQVLLWKAGFKDNFHCVADESKKWKQLYGQTIQHLSKASWESGPTRMKFHLHVDISKFGPDEQNEMKKRIAALLQANTDHLVILELEPDQGFWVTMEAPAVLCEAMYRIFHYRSRQKALEAMDIDKVTFHSITDSRREETRYVGKTAPRPSTSSASLEHGSADTATDMEEKMADLSVVEPTGCDVETGDVGTSCAVEREQSRGVAMTTKVTDPLPTQELAGPPATETATSSSSSDSRQRPPPALPRLHVTSEGDKTRHSGLTAAGEHLAPAVAAADIHEEDQKEEDQKEEDQKEEDQEEEDQSAMATAGNGASSDQSSPTADTSSDAISTPQAAARFPKPQLPMVKKQPQEEKGESRQMTKETRDNSRGNTQVGTVHTRNVNATETRSHRAFLVRLQECLDERMGMHSTRKLCEAYIKIAGDENLSTTLRKVTMATLFQVMEERQDVKGDDVVFLQVLLWRAGFNDLFQYVADESEKWKQRYGQTIQYLREPSLESGFQHVSFHLDLKIENFPSEVLHEIKRFIAVMLQVNSDEVVITQVLPSN